MTLEVNKEKLKEVCNQNDITYLGVFGSVARGEQTLNSDVDLLVEFSDVKSLFELVRIEERLNKAIPGKLDLVLRKSLKKRVEPYVYQDLVPLYEER